MEKKSYINKIISLFINNKFIIPPERDGSEKKYCGINPVGGKRGK